MPVFVFIIILALFIIGLLVRSGGEGIHIFEDKGTRGERIVGSVLADLPEGYFVFNDVMIKRYNGKTSQIDHVVVSKHGVFVIETKNYDGKIYGSEDAEQWTEYYNYYSGWTGRNSDAYKLYNPVRQNEGHIKTLKMLLNKHGFIPFFSLIAFSDDADLKVSVSSAEVTHMYDLPDAILSHTEITLPDETVASIIQAIQDANIDEDAPERVAHIENAQNARNRSIQRIQNGRCPRCGGELRLIQGPYGEFYGCSNYPACKFKAKC